MMSPYYAQFGLTPPQFQTLTVLNQLSNERVTQRGLARELYVSFPNTTVMLARLEKNGYIERTANPTDRRENFVRISRSGRALLRKTWKFQPTQLERAMAGLEDEERNELSRLLNKMISGQDGRPIDIESFAADGSS
ncbi:MAG: MarR family transcriptional regulator [Planctomycetales bacterium]